MSPERLIEKACVEQRDRINAILDKHLNREDVERSIEVYPPMGESRWIARVSEWSDEETFILLECEGESFWDCIAQVSQALEFNEN